MTILTWSEQPALAAQLVTGARALAAASGGGASGGGARGVAGVAIEADTPPERVVELLCAAAATADPPIILVGATKLGLEVAPRVAERLGAAYAPWTVALVVEADGSITARCTTYAGSAQAACSFRPGTAVATVGPGVFDAEVDPEPVQLISPEVHSRPSRVAVLESRPKVRGEGIGDAGVVVDVGQGVRERGDLDLIRELAAVLNAAVACSRPVAADRDWFPEWLGLSGARISPDLCLTIGVSGAIQHIVGIRESRVIAAVNSDQGAAIFSQADVGVVADLYEFVPALIQRLRARNIVPAGKL